MSSGARTARAWSEWQGQIVDGKFPLTKFLGGTAQSAVFLTERAEGDPREAAIKLVPADSAAAEDLLARWTAAAHLSHPDLVRLFEAGRGTLADVEFAYVVMEYAEENLGQVDRALTASEAADMLDGILGALSYLHDKGLAHGRLKPSNVLAVRDHLKISSDSVRPSGEWSDSSDPPGLCDPPEIAHQGLSPAGDVWSMGVTLVQALAQRIPSFDGTDVSADLLESLSVQFRSVVSNCLRIDPGRRLNVAGIRESFKSQAPKSAPSPAEPHATVKKSYLLLAAAVVFAVGALAIVSRIPPRQPQELKQATVTDPPAAPPAVPAPTPAEKTTKAPPQKAFHSSDRRVLTQVLPEVPAKARNTIRGKVTIRIRVQVDGTGWVVSARNESPQASRFFGNLALQAARRWKFEPEDPGSSAHPAEWNLQFQFVKDARKPVSVQAARAR